MEEHGKLKVVEEQRQKETEHGREMIEVEDDSVDEVEQK